MKRKRLVAFTTDKLGRPIAYEDDRSLGAGCWRRIGYDKAKLMLSTGQATQIPYRPRTRTNPTKGRPAAKQPRTPRKVRAKGKRPPRAFIRWVMAGRPGLKPKGKVPARRPLRKNLDGFLQDGVFHPIRASKGYYDAYLTVMPAHLQRAYEAERDTWAEEYDDYSGDYWRKEVERAVKSITKLGIAPHRDKGLGWEYRHDVPLHLRNRKGLPPDEIADALKRQYPHLGISSEDDLLQALKG